MSNSKDVLERAGKVLIGNYGRLPVVFERGSGSTLRDADGKQYIDLFAGFGGCILGHSYPELIEAATNQAKLLWHVGNAFHTEPQVRFAEALNKTAFEGKAFFCHSGLEANEAACKLARLRGHDRKRWKIISLQKSFHGRSLAMISATGNPKVRVGFEPGTPGFVRVEPNDFDALKNAVDAETAGILIEPIQGEGGINLFSNDYIRNVRTLCDEQKLTLIFDEVWCCGGRTGKWFGYQHFTDASGKTIQPDIITLGKAVGGGLPVAAMFARPDIAELLVPGKHGCTLGGNPICMAVARKIFDVIERDNLLTHANNLGETAIKMLRSSAAASKIKEVRGRGLMLGIELATPQPQVVEKALARGVIINLTAEKVIRLAPPINIEASAWQDGLEKVVQTIAEG